MACGGVQRAPLITENEGELRARKGGGLRSTITTFDNDESKGWNGPATLTQIWRLGFAEWHYLFGP